ncbi:hypothetical protein M2263_001452 [Providencia alcalifaciens]|nr:hypothetical protein [Providencia alcalifaciens]
MTNFTSLSSAVQSTTQLRELAKTTEKTVHLKDVSKLKSDIKVVTNKNLQLLKESAELSSKPRWLHSVMGNTIIDNINIQKANIHYEKTKANTLLNDISRSSYPHNPAKAKNLNQLIDILNQSNKELNQAELNVKATIETDDNNNFMNGLKTKNATF